MNIKGVVNLRRLDEFYDEFGRNCEECPFGDYCHTKISMVCMIEDILGYEDNEDLYDMERNGTLDKDFKIQYNNTENN